MSVDPSALRSRRALLGGVLGGVAALAANALGRADRALGGAGSENDPVVVGGEYYDARSKIYINNGTNNDFVFAAQSTAGGRAIHGRSNNNIGVMGVADTAGHGVHGVANAASSTGVWGESSDGTGVTASSVGGTGLSAYSNTGVGLLARSSWGPALQVRGPADFDRGLMTTVAVGTRSVTVSVPFDLTAASQVHATLDTNQSGLFLHSVMKNAADNKLKLTLNTTVASGKYAKVAWIAFK